MPFSDIYQIIIFIIPGFITSRIRSDAFPGVRDTDFGRVVSSVIYSVISIAVVGLGCLIFDIGIPESKKGGFLVMGVSLVTVSIILGYTLILYENIKRKFFNSKSHELSTWADVNSTFGKGSWIVVKLRDGACYKGWIKIWKYDPDNPSENDFFLADASAIDEATLDLKYRVFGPGVYVKSSEVSFVEYLS